ncbi:MAG TPA: hypothetical protein VEY32_02845, partial [Flavisolibacter sp.]|nr:hypothetical protein [Flavisolibacter sp.]
HLNKSQNWQSPEEIPALNDIVTNQQIPTATASIYFTLMLIWPMHYFVRPCIIQHEYIKRLLATGTFIRSKDSALSSLYKKDAHRFTEYAFSFLALLFIMMGYLAIDLLQQMNSVTSPYSYPIPATKILLEDEVTDKKADFTYQNAIGWDLVAVDTSVIKRHTENHLSDWRKQVKLTSESILNAENNQYEQQILLLNFSPYHITDAIIEIQFLNESGKVLAIEEFYIKHILPDRKRILQRLPLKDGIQIKQRIKEIRTKENLPYLVEI